MRTSNLHGSVLNTIAVSLQKHLRYGLAVIFRERRRRRRRATRTAVLERFNSVSRFSPTCTIFILSYYLTRFLEPCARMRIINIIIFASYPIATITVRVVFSPFFFGSSKHARILNKSRCALTPGHRDIIRAYIDLCLRCKRMIFLS